MCAATAFSVAALEAVRASADRAGGPKHGDPKAKFIRIKAASDHETIRAAVC